jgi:hypothetical protein
MGILLVTSILLLLLALPLIFLRGGAREPVTAMGRPTAIPSAEIDLAAEQLVRALGLEIVRRDPDEGDGPAFVTANASPTNRQLIYVRAFHLPSGARVREPEVVAAIDFARSEGFHKTILISPNGFSDEALLAAEDSIAELIDDVALSRILHTSVTRFPKRDT